MSDYLKSADSDWYKQRLIHLLPVVVIAFAVLWVRLLYLQVLEGEEFRRLSAHNSIRLQNIDPPRGNIFDRQGHLLVDNRPSYDLYINFKDAQPLDTTLARLSSLLDIPLEELQTTVRRRKAETVFKPALLKQDVERDRIAVLESHRLGLPGISVRVKARRHYLANESAAHLIGYMSEINTRELGQKKYAMLNVGDYIGKFGVERSFENYLRGRRGGRQVEVNATGQVVRVLQTVPAQPGHNIFLSIDAALQKRAETLLAGQAGAVVALQPSSGQVLALASSPSFDQNAFVDGMSQKVWNDLISNPRRPMENKALQGEYPPASTYKLVVTLAGLEEGIVDENTTVYCPGHYRLGNRVFRCWKRGGHGTVDLFRAVTESCDVFFYVIGQRLGVDRLAWYAKGCGLGAETGIDLGHESRGLVPTSRWKERRTGVPWQKGETLSVAIGQGYNLVTPLQMAVFMAAIANGGTLYRPTVVKEVRSAAGELVMQTRPVSNGQLPVSNESLDRLKQTLWAVVNTRKGTAWRSRLSDISMSGKTGTAQIFSRKTNESLREEDIAQHLKSHAWFVAYAPSENPRIALAVIVEHGAHGSSAAAPIARELIQTYLKPEEDG